MGKRLTGNGFIDEFNAFYEVNQLAKNLSDLYYIGKDGMSIYMRSSLSFANRFILLKEPLVYYRKILVPPINAFSVMKDFKKTKMRGYSELKTVADTPFTVIHLEQESKEEDGKILSIDLYMMDENCVEVNDFYSRRNFFPKYVEDHTGWHDVGEDLLDRLISGRVVQFSIGDPLEVGLMHIATTRHVIVGAKPGVKMSVKIIPERDPNITAKRWIMYRLEYPTHTSYTMTANLKV